MSRLTQTEDRRWLALAALVAAGERAIAQVEERLFVSLDAEERAQLHRLLAKVADSSGILAGCAQLIDAAE